jgi:hypothetical protein
MSTRCPLLRLTRWLLLLALLGGLASCAAKAPATGPQAWIDSPADGVTVPAGLPVPVVCRASAPEGVAEVLLEVNGTPYRSMPVAGAAETCAVTIDWLPTVPGAYTLQVTAYDRTGVGSTPATAMVKVEGATSASPTETPAPAATATVTEEAEPTATPTVATATPRPTAEPTATASVTPYPPPEVSFTVAQDAINEGQCTTLHWSVEHVTAVYLDGEGIGGEGSREVCPPETTTYTLHIEAPAGNVDATLTVTVLPDETPPPVPKLKSPENGQTLTPAACPGKIALEWRPVTDPSGVVYHVILQGKTALSWRTVEEWEALADSAVKTAVECGQEYRWSVRARDGAGNWSAWAPTFTFKVAAH